MTEAYGDRLRKAFDEALSVPTEQRAAYVHDRHSTDNRLAAELLAMLGHVKEDDGFLEPIVSEQMRDLMGRSEEAESADDALPDLTGFCLADRYVLGERLGKGGAGVVHEARDRLTGATIAVKLLRDDAERTRLDLRREATTLRLLRLPGVVQLLDDGVENGRAYLVTERVDGLPFPGEPGRLSWSALDAVATALLESLERMHRAGIVHGDLKPGNVLVRSDGVPVILDLGIAERMRAGAAESLRRGTLRYVAPEQIRDGIVTPRSDLHAVGVMLYEALTGAPYRSEPSVAFTRLGVVSNRLKPLDQTDADVPEHVRTIIERLLAPEAEFRPASARETLDDLHPESVVGRASMDDPFPAPGCADDLRERFAGFDRLHHIREDAAAQLWRRTEGRPESIISELDAWSRAGLGWWEGRLYHIRRRDIAQLERMAHSLAPRLAHGTSRDDLDRREAEILLVIELAGPRTDTDLIASALAWPATEVEGLMASLEERRWLASDAERGWVIQPTPAGLLTRAVEAREELHRRIAFALPPGDERRLQHLIAAGRFEEVPAESLAVAETLLVAGDIPGARTAVQAGLAALPLEDAPAALGSLLELHLLVALQVGTKGALDEHLYRLGCFRPDAQLDRQERIVRGVLEAVEGRPERGLEDLPSPQDGASETMLRCMVSTRLFVARLCGEAVLRVETERAERLAERLASTPLRAAVSGARAWLLYSTERHAEAGDAHLAAARAVPYATTRVSSLLSAASSYLDAAAFDRAELLAQEARAFALARRHALVEARAEYITRAAAYRRGDVLEPDLALVEAGWKLGGPQLAPILALTEAAIAWRLGSSAIAQRLADDAAQAWRGDAHRRHRLLARALAAASSPSVARDVVEELLAECRACPVPRIAVQAAALLGQANPQIAVDCHALVLERSEAVSDVAPDVCLEILSLREAAELTES